MTRRVGAVVIALALLADASAAVAQTRFRREGVQPAPARRSRPLPSTPSTGAPAENPPTGTRSTSRLALAPRTLVDVRQFPFPFHMGLGWASFGFVPLWMLDGVVPLQAGAPMLAPPLEGAPTGGVQLDIEPRDAQVYVDGTNVGVVSDFSGYYEHLNLVAGPHLVTVVAPDYEPMMIQVMVSPGRTLTYRAALTRAHGR